MVQRPDQLFGRTGIGAEVAADVTLAVASHDRFKHGSPAVRRMDVARTQRRTLQVAKLVERRNAQMS